MNFFDVLATTLAEQNKKQHKLFLLASLGIIVALSISGLYYLHMQRGSDIEELVALQELSKKNDGLMMKSERIQLEADRIQTLLESNKGFSIKTFFEGLTQEQKMKPEAGWETETRSIEGNDTFDEILLPATFKGQTTQSLVSLLAALENHELVYIKELEIKKESAKTISFQITIATKKRKQIWED